MDEDMPTSSTSPTSPTSPTRDECNIAMLAHLLGVFSGFIGALIIWLLKRDDSPFIAEQTTEALNFQITIAIAMFAAVLLTFVFIGALLIPVIVIANFVLSLLGAMSASKGQAYRYPLALRLVK
jgi:uncharacterized Tic20 family protein